MAAAEASPGLTSPPTRTRTPEGLRQRQRDYLSPRGRVVKPGQPSASVREVGGAVDNGTVTGLRSRPTATRSPEMPWKKRTQDGPQKEDISARRARREAESVKPDITPDGGSAGREGRQFTVAKVGNNGRIYLRPTIRPANERYPHPSFVFPNTPPNTGGLEILVSQNEGTENSRESLWTPSRSPSTFGGLPRPVDSSSPGQVPQPTRPKRAHSYSTIDEQQLPALESDVGAFKVVIERPGAKARATDFTHGLPSLEVPIPSYKLGTPRFSTRGTAFLRNSSHTGTDDMRSSIFTHQDASRQDVGSQRHTRVLSRRHSDASPQPHIPTFNPSSQLDSSSILSPRIVRRRTAIVPGMFDALTFKPACDHPSVVRYSMHGAIRAATPERLVAEITSPTFVDYDLLSDFFLTFRSFLETGDLLLMLIARLKWALSRGDEIGIVVRVRTFVAIRHWILNYFLDDYVVDYDLRKSFCDLLNNFADDLPNDAARAKVPLKILGELRKCWRRLCALYWDGPEFSSELGNESPILPGGIAGSRNPELDPTFWQARPDEPPRLDGIIEPDFIEPDTSTLPLRNYFADVSRAGHVESFASTPRFGADEDGIQNPPLSPTSMLSEDFVSCSFPSRGRAVAGGQPLGAHPVVASSVYDNSQPIAMTPKALTGKRVRPTHAHKRSGSFSDSFRDQRSHQQSVQKVIYKSTEILLAFPYAGSLVRGNMFPPGQAFVDVGTPSTPGEGNRITTRFPGITVNQKAPSAMSGPGMKRLLGSVRRALSTRNLPSPNASPTQGSFPHIPPLGVRGVTINRLPGTAIVPQARPRNTGTKSPMRIDLLGAEIAEDFKKAVREDADAEAEVERKESLHGNSIYNSGHHLGIHYSTMAPDTTMDSDQPTPSRDLASGVTAGSKSILIVDDTMPPDLPFMTGALPINPSVDTFADAFMQPSGGPTPPSTPPEAQLGTPRRSSHLLGHHTRNGSHSLEGTPSLIVDSRPSRDDEEFPSQLLVGRPSVRSRGGKSKMKRSVSLRRYASFQSGFTQHRSERSFDATTFTGSEDLDGVSSVQGIPHPLRILRRRPGGDLRAVSNVGDLNTHPLRRPMSTGSLTTYSESVRSSYLLGEVGDYVEATDGHEDRMQNDAQRFSLGALAETSPGNHVSLFSTHSSQPIMRPSFEKEAKFLAQIPDDINDDGGVESALLKLEGKYEQRLSQLSTDLANSSNFLRHGNSFGVVPHEVSTLTLGDDEEEKRRHRHEHVVEKVSTLSVPVVAAYRPQPQHLEELQPVAYVPKGMQTKPSVTTRRVESYNSTPLLERGLTDDEHDFRVQRDWSSHSILRGPSNERPEDKMLTPHSSHPNSFDFINETESLKNIQVNHPEHSVHQSFLDSESDTSDLSSELSLEVISRTEYTAHDSSSTRTFPRAQASVTVKEIIVPSHPLRQPSSPTITPLQKPKLTEVPNIQSHYLPQGHRNGLPTPEITPTAAISRGLFGAGNIATPSIDPLRSNKVVEPSRKTSDHLPFVLAFDSQVLAQQFTLIEKDALNEIDWKDLIEMRWKDSGNTDSRSWVEFLRTSEPRGVEVVIARFNLMVKWAVSECVLTHDLNERVRCIIKLIHVAAQCRKYRNFATMTQLTVALTSKDIARLTKTWAYVPAADVRTLKDMEALVTPTSNFYSLRAEMEGSGADLGCIPFVGIYTHDLLVNSERPSQIASTPTTDPLTNFERCRTDATIVKNLLRLLEASQLYRFLPIEGVTERCLWMAALSDEEIIRYGNMIQG